MQTKCHYQNSCLITVKRSLLNSSAWSIVPHTPEMRAPLLLLLTMARDFQIKTLHMPVILALYTTFEREAYRHDGTTNEKS